MPEQSGREERIRELLLLWDEARESGEEIGIETRASAHSNPFRTVQTRLIQGRQQSVSGHPSILCRIILLHI